MSMKIIAVMQPYFFPYLGYFQLIDKVDHFVFLDDVNYFKKGFINRNNVWSKQGVQSFSLPIKGASQNKLIKELDYLNDNEKFKNTIIHIYKKSPFFNQLIDNIFQVTDAEEQAVSSVNGASIIMTCNYLGLKKSFSFSSELGLPQTLSAENRIIEICRAVEADTYINPMAGMHLYNEQTFSEQKIKLRELNPCMANPYLSPQNVPSPNLSVLHYLFSFEKQQINDFICLGQVKTPTYLRSA